MRLLYPTLGALAILAVFTFLIGRQNKDLLRVRAYRDFFLRLIPPLSTGVFIAGLPFVMNLTTIENYGPVLLVYLGGAAVLTVLMTRAVTPEERRAGTAFRRGEYEKAADLYDEISARRPLPRYYSALGASLDASGNPGAALEATEQAISSTPGLASPTTTGHQPSPPWTRRPAHAATCKRSSRSTRTAPSAAPPRKPSKAWKRTSQHAPPFTAACKEDDPHCKPLAPRSESGADMLKR